MTDIQVINAMNQSVINKITEFKNKEIKKADLNNFMFANLSYILKKTAKIKSKNEKIKKEQNIEIKNSLSKIKSINGKINFDSNELENKSVMKKVLNPTLEVYIPLSEISYSTELKLSKDMKDNNKFSGNSIMIEEEQKEKENDDKELYFEEAPITFNKFSNFRDKYIFGEKYLNINKDNFLNLINQYDDDLMTNKDDNEQYNTNLFYELINSFDEEDKVDLGFDDINSDIDKFKSDFYLDDIFNRISNKSKRNSYENYICLSSASDSTSFGSNSGSFVGNHCISKSIYEDEFANYMSFDSFKKNTKEMSLEYLRYMLIIYANTISKSNKWFYCEKKMFINLIKSFLLKIGISSKKLFEKISQKIINYSNKEKKNICSFENFLKCFNLILKLDDENEVLKYKFLIALSRVGDEDINVKHVNIFIQLLKGEAVYDSELWDNLKKNIVQKYDKIYSNEPGNNFRFDKMMICIETFFDKNFKK